MAAKSARKTADEQATFSPPGPIIQQEISKFRRKNRLVTYHQIKYVAQVLMNKYDRRFDAQSNDYCPLRQLGHLNWRPISSNQ